VRSSTVVRILPILAVAWLVLLPASAAAFPMSGSCTLKVTSTDAKGNILDTATSGDPSASESDPLQIDWEGMVTWSASSTIALQNNRYHVEMFGVPTPFQGSSANTGDSRASTGTFAFSASAPFRFAGLYYITGGITGSGGACDGNLVVKLVGDPILTVPFVVSLALLVIGALLVLWGFSGHLLAALFGGLILGLGMALVLVVFSFLPSGAVTPLAVLLLGIGLGVATAVTGWVRMRARARLALAAAGSVAGGPTAVEPPAVEQLVVEQPSGAPPIPVSPPTTPPPPPPDAAA